MVRWLVREDKDGSATLVKGRRTVSTHPDTDAALAEAQRQREPGDTVYHEAPDGYRTRKSPRRGWRQEG